MRPSLLSARAAMLATAMLLTGAAGAQATVDLVDITGATLTVVGTVGDDAPRFKYYQPADGASPGYTVIFDNGNVNGALPAGCDRVDPDLIQPMAKIMRCTDGGTAPLLTKLVLVLGSGNDVPEFQECFDIVDLALGEGTNSVQPPPCLGGAFTVTSGAGQDTVFPPDLGTTMAITANLGAGDDTFTGGDGDDVVHAGDGHDYLVRSAGNDQHFGEGGPDDIMGGPGNDIEDGGPGDDRIGYSAGISNDDDQGADTLRGGDGVDKLLLNAHIGGMTISIDGLANDGAPGEGDNIAGDFEQIDGTASNDVFTGSPGPDKFVGGAGNDEVRGGAGDDDLSGDGGDDRVFGDAGNDKVQGLQGADKVDGGSGTDQIYGDIAACSVFCSFDPDEIFARDGERDTVDCGSGADTAHVDSLDVVAFCTVVNRLDLTPPAPPPASVPLRAAELLVPGAIRSKALLARGVAVRLTCFGPCTGVAELRYKSKKVGSARATLLKNGRVSFVVKLSTAGKRALRGLRKGKLTLRLTVTDAAGKKTTLSRTITFRR
jgi:Ca2+-binding RTX toxin-like protein